MKKAVQRINSILRHAESIKNFLADISEEDWGTNQEKQYASIYSLMAISENVKELLKLDNSLVARHESIPWSDIARFSDRMSHHYDTINAATIFEICKTNIPPLEKVIQQEKKRFLSQDLGR